MLYGFFYVYPHWVSTKSAMYWPFKREEKEDWIVVFSTKVIFKFLIFFKRSCKKLRKICFLIVCHQVRIQDTDTFKYKHVNKKRCWELTWNWKHSLNSVLDVFSSRVMLLCCDPRVTVMSRDSLGCRRLAQNLVSAPDSRTAGMATM